MGTPPGRDAAGIALALIAFLAVAVAPAGGVTRVHYAKNGGQPKVFFAKSGLKLRGSCEGPVGVAPLSTRPRRRSAMLGATSQSAGAGDQHSYLGVERFHSKSDGFQLLDGTGLAASDSSVGQLIHADRKRVTSIDWMAETADAIGKQCVFGGVATTAKKGSQRAVIYRANEGAELRKIYAEDGLELFGRCDTDGGEPDLDILARSIGSGIYQGSHSDVDQNGTDEQAFAGYEGFDGNDKLDLEVSNVPYDRAAGQAVITTSNPILSIDWVASSSRALGKDCAFAATVTTAGSSSNKRVIYFSFGPEPAGPFYSLGDLELEAGCPASDLTFAANSLLDGSSVHLASQSDANSDASDFHLYAEGDPLDAGAGIQVLNSAEEENVVGQILQVAPGGSYVSIDFVADEGELGGGADCLVTGVAARAPAP